MILEGNQRGGAKNLALHLMKQENEHVEMHELRGFVAQDLMGALNEAYAISRGTKCKQFLYSLSLNPPLNENVSIADFEAAIDKSEKELGLEGQPRAIVFHEKEGRRHAHAVWSRIDVQEMKAIQMSYDHMKLQSVSRELYLEHGWKMPRGFARGSERDPKNFTHEEWQQAKRVDKDPRDIKTAIQDAWAISDTKTAFSHALQERGYTLARGDRKGRIVAVDIHGEVYSIPRQAGIKVTQVRKRIGDEKALPSVDEAKQQVTNNMLPVLERFKNKLKIQETVQKSEFNQARMELLGKQRHERSKFKERIKVRQQNEAIARQARFRTGFKGLWDRLRGEHKRTAAENEQAAALALKRDRIEKNQLIANQLAQRRMFGQWKQAMRSNFKDKRRELGKDISHYKDMEQNASSDVQAEFIRVRKETAKARPKQKSSRTRGPSLER